MSFITLKCKNCGGSMSLNTESHSATCTHCGSTFILADLLDDLDINFAEKTSAKNIEQKMQAGDHLKQGETCLYQANYEEAEKHFKKAIEYDDTNYRAYLGVVKAKTQNLNVIPDNDDYKEYAKCALQFAGVDDEVYVKSELAKIDLLRRESARQTKARRARERMNEIKKNKRKRINKFFTKITIIVSIVFVAAVLIFNFLFSNGNWDRLFESNINVTSAKEFVEALSNSENMEATINIKNDIDFDNASITAFGSSTTPFAGKINGNSHKLSNLNISTTNAENSSYGLFNTISNASINNLILENISINCFHEGVKISSNSVGILAGTAINSTIKNVEVTTNCEISIMSDNFSSLIVGGLVGKISSTTKISSVSSNTTITADFVGNGDASTVCIGGVVGHMEKSYISSCFSQSDIETTMANTKTTNSKLFIGGNIGYIHANGSTADSITKSIFAGKISTYCTKTDQVIAGIAACGADLNAQASNYCLVTSENILKNTISLAKEDLADYYYTEYFMLCTDDHTLIKDKLTQIFESKNWTVGLSEGKLSLNLNNK